MDGKAMDGKATEEKEIDEYIGDASAEMPVNGDPDEWRNWIRRTVMFLAGQTVSLIGSSLVQFAIIWYITLTTKSGVMMTISTLCGFLPQLMISIFAGVWADRYPRKTLIILADAVIAFATLVMAVFFMLGYRELWLLFLVSGIRSVGAGVQAPAVSAMIPQLVPAKFLMKVNGIHNSIGSVVMLISPVVSGALLATTTLETTFFIDVVTAAIAIGILFAIKITPHKKALMAKTTGYFQDLKEGLRYAGNHSLVKKILVFYAVFFFLLAPVAFLTPLMVTRSFGSEVWRLTINEVSFFAGSMIGGLVISIWGGFKNRMNTIIFSCIIFGMLTIGLGVAPLFYIYLIVMFFSGLPVPFFSTAITVMLQENVEQDMQGRIFGFVQIVITAMLPLGMVIFGPVADIVKVEYLLVLTGIMMVVQGIYIWFLSGVRKQKFE
ncbi:MAG: MFS transporter [Saccharofermentanales bacterium]